MVCIKFEMLNIILVVFINNHSPLALGNGVTSILFMFKSPNLYLDQNRVLIPLVYIKFSQS